MRPEASQSFATCSFGNSKSEMTVEKCTQDCLRAPRDLHEAELEREKFSSRFAILSSGVERAFEFWSCLRWLRLDHCRRRKTTMGTMIIPRTRRKLNAVRIVPRTHSFASGHAHWFSDALELHCTILHEAFGPTEVPQVHSQVKIWVHNESVPPRR